MLETERLLIRKFTMGDLPRLIEMRSDGEVNKYLGGTRLQNPEMIEKRLGFYISCYDTHEFGLCAMIWKESGEMIGWSGIQPLDGTDEIELGYGMIKEYWRRGIGIEAARAWLKYGFEEARLNRIVAVAYPENIGSWGIMEKLGMRREKLAHHYGAECYFYAISREEFAANS